MRTVAERFWDKVDRRGKHHLWLGATDRDGTPQVRINGHLTTARRVAWQLAHGALLPGQTVASCPGDSRCVRVEHLFLGRTRTATAPFTPPRKRTRRTTGSMREVRAGVWELAITDTSGNRRYRTVRGDNQIAERVLNSFAAESSGRATTLDALIHAYLAHLGVAGRSPTTIRRYEQLWRTWLQPPLGALHPDKVTTRRVEASLRGMADATQSASSIHQAAVLLSSAYRWATDQDRVESNPVTGASLADGTTIAAPRHR
jgi:hypothetical protein